MITITAAEFKKKHAKEANVYKKVAAWLKAEHPNLIYRWDASADMRLTMGQAVKLKALQMTNRGYPDLFIAKPLYSASSNYSGAYFEIKREGEKLFKKDGITYASEHLKEQTAMLQHLLYLGYYATFTFGFEDTKKKIEDYLNGRL